LLLTLLRICKLFSATEKLLQSSRCMAGAFAVEQTCKIFRQSFDVARGTWWFGPRLHLRDSQDRQ